MTKDLPLLKSVIPREFSAVLVKGRGNYLSLRRLHSALERSVSLFSTRKSSFSKSAIWQRGRSGRTTAR